MPRKLTNLKIDEVSFCKDGMNQHAKVALFKSRDRTSTSPHAIAKATFQEALEGNMIAGAVNEAFFDSFDGLWERNDAFRDALTDELAAGGDGTTASAAYVESVKALVDEAVAAARNAGSTAADTSGVDKALTHAVGNWLAAKSKEQTMPITTKAQLTAAIAKFASAGVAATIGDRDAILKAAVDLSAEDLLPADGPLAKAAPAANADLVRKVAILEMPTEVRKHFDGLPEADQAAFLAKTPAERADIVTKANEGDPIVYTAGDGTEIRKSHGPIALAAAKRADALEKRLNEMGGQLTETTLAKRAAAFPNVADKVAIDMLKSVDQVGADSEAGKALMASLDRMNKASTGLFKSLGSGADDGAGGGDQSALAEFNGEVEKTKSATPGLGHADAIAKVRVSNPDLFKRAFPVAAEAEAQFEEVD
jgi:hypothetical protein